MRLQQFAAAVLMVVAAGATQAGGQAPRTVDTGFLNRTVHVDGVEYRYQVYVPREFNRAAAWPVILALHGGGEYGNDGIKQTDVGLARAIRRHADRFPALVVFPQSPADATPSWQLKGGEAALAAVDQTIAEFNGDPKRVYLTGYSAGGNGSWFLASHHADRFAAMVVVCGFISQLHSSMTGITYPSLAPAAEPDPSLYVARQVAALPIWVFHGDSDRVVSVEESRNMVKALKALGADVQYTELPGVDHNAWDPAYERVDWIDWLLKQRKK
jgi:predicted peptidase